MRKIYLLLSVLVLICFVGCEKQLIDNKLKNQDELKFNEPFLDYSKNDQLLDFADRLKKHEVREVINESYIPILSFGKDEILRRNSEKYEIVFSGENKQIFYVNYIVSSEKLTSITYFNPDELSYEDILKYAEQKGYKEIDHNSIVSEYGTYYVNNFIDEEKECNIKAMSFEPKLKDGERKLSITYEKVI